jgi:hypothetical protein
VLTHDAWIAEESQRCPACLDLVHPGRAILRDLLLEMEAQLCVKLGVRRPAAEECMAPQP